MSIVKSFSFPEGKTRGDTFYIQHNSDNFTLIDCYLKDGNDASCRKNEIIGEIKHMSEGRISRFISTHPDNDHILGIADLDAQWEILNFYAVKNQIPANLDDTSLTKYLDLLKNKNYAIEAGIQRKWLNDKNEERSGSGIHFLWPILSNEKFAAELEKVARGESPNNISCIFIYSVKNGATYMWMGDMETDMQQEYYEVCKDKIPHVDILFHPHHGRNSASIPNGLLKALSPKLIIIGNAPSEYLNYGDSTFTITQNTSGDILFKNVSSEVHVYTSNIITNIPNCLYKKRGVGNFIDYRGRVFHYCGTLNV